MKRLTLLCLVAERDRTLEALGALGVVHLTPIPAVGDVGLEHARRALTDTERAMALLAEHAPGPTAAPSATAASLEMAPEMTPEMLVWEILDIDQHLQLLEEQNERLLHEIRTLSPFGEFSAAQLGALGQHGVEVALCHAEDRDQMVVPRDAYVQVFLETKGEIDYVVVGAELGDLANRLSLPDRSLHELQAAHAAVVAEMDEVTARLRELYGHHTLLPAHLAMVAQRIQFLEARVGMGTTAVVAYLQGFCPADAIPGLNVEAARHGWAVMATEPGGDDRVPTFVRTPRWVQPIQSLFQMIRIFPGYRELDVSVSFLLFLSLFFAMIIGDAGYGAVFLGATIGARWKFGHAPPEPFRLLAIFSVCTMVWGVLTGVYFGQTDLPGLLAPHIPWLTSDANIMALCILIGAIHLSVAHAWNVIRMSNSTRAIGQAGWLAITWVVYFAARNMLLKVPLPAFFVPLTVAGLVAIVLFMTPWNLLKDEWVSHAMLPMTLVGNFGDILSYLRLWALGIAGVQLARAFNQIGAQLWDAGYLGWIIGIVVLILGHGLNVVLGALSVLVHGVRLNALEFSMHIGLEWTGFEYKPFRLVGGREAV